jgi:hypothetical protein
MSRRHRHGPAQGLALQALQRGTDLGRLRRDLHRGATSHTWQQALQLTDRAADFGHADWRRPKIKALPPIVEQVCYRPAIDVAVFPGTPSSCFRSASTPA